MSRLQFLVQSCQECNKEFFAYSETIAICDKCQRQPNNQSSTTDKKSTTSWNSEIENFSQFTDKMLKSIKRDTTLADIASEMDLLPWRGYWKSILENHAHIGEKKINRGNSGVLVNIGVFEK